MGFGNGKSGSEGFRRISRWRQKVFYRVVRLKGLSK